MGGVAAQPLTGKREAESVEPDRTSPAAVPQEAQLSGFRGTGRAEMDEWMESGSWGAREPWGRDASGQRGGGHGWRRLLQFFHSMPCRDRAWLGWGQGEGGRRPYLSWWGPQEAGVEALCFHSAHQQIGSRGALCTVQDGCLCCRWGRGREGSCRMCWPGGTEPAQVAWPPSLHPGQAALSGDLEWGQGLEAAHPSLPGDLRPRTLQASWAPLPAAFPRLDPARHTCSSLRPAFRGPESQFGNCVCFN